MCDPEASEGREWKHARPSTAAGEPNDEGRRHARRNHQNLRSAQFGARARSRVRPVCPTAPPHITCLRLVTCQGGKSEGGGSRRRVKSAAPWSAIDRVATMFELRIDLSQIRQLADDLGVARDQIPFAAARVMNDAAFITRDALVHDTWP
jgi:uncharacterized protein YjiS (DUF1127 family)